MWIIAILMLFSSISASEAEKSPPHSIRERLVSEREKAKESQKIRDKEQKKRNRYFRSRQEEYNKRRIEKLEARKEQKKRKK